MASGRRRLMESRHGIAAGYNTQAPALAVTLGPCLNGQASAFRTPSMNSMGWSGLNTMVSPLVRLISTGVLNDVANHAPQRTTEAAPGAGLLKPPDPMFLDTERRRMRMILERTLAEFERISPSAQVRYTYVWMDSERNQMVEVIKPEWLDQQHVKYRGSISTSGRRLRELGPGGEVGTGERPDIDGPFSGGII